MFVANDPSNDPTELAGLTEYNRVSTDRLDLSPGPVAALDQSQNSNAPAVTREAEEDRHR